MSISVGDKVVTSNGNIEKVFIIHKFINYNGEEGCLYYTNIDCHTFNEIYGIIKKGSNLINRVVIE